MASQSQHHEITVDTKDAEDVSTTVDLSNTGLTVLPAHLFKSNLFLYLFFVVRNPINILILYSETSLDDV